MLTKHSLAKIIYQPKLLAMRKQRNFIAVDERMTKINREKRYLWAAIDVFFCLLSGIILLGVILGLMLHGDITEWLQEVMPKFTLTVSFLEGKTLNFLFPYLAHAR